MVRSDVTLLCRQMWRALPAGAWTRQCLRFVLSDILAQDTNIKAENSEYWQKASDILDSACPSISSERWSCWDYRTPTCYASPGLFALHLA